MNVTHPISCAIPTLDGPVLTVLAGTTQPLSLSDIHRLCGTGSVSGVRLVLLRLTRSGLVTDSSGRYALNRHHLAAPAVEQLATLHGQLIERIRSAIDEWGGQASLAALFGSAARRDGSDDSDIDVLIVSDDVSAVDLGDQLAEQIHLWTGNPAQVIVRSSQEIDRLRRSGEPIVGNWETDVMVLHGHRDALTASLTASH